MQEKFDGYKIHITFVKGSGWTLAREVCNLFEPFRLSPSLEYLHTDGAWRKSTAVYNGGKAVFSGYFPTEKAVREALSDTKKTKGKLSLPLEAFSDPATIKLMTALYQQKGETK